MISNGETFLRVSGNSDAVPRRVLQATIGLRDSRGHHASATAPPEVRSRIFFAAILLLLPSQWAFHPDAAPRR